MHAANVQELRSLLQIAWLFPADATVQLEDGSTKAMPDVRLGDRVLVARANGSLGFEDVYLNAHKDQASSAPYVELTLASGAGCRYHHAISFLWQPGWTALGKIIFPRVPTNSWPATMSVWSANGAMQLDRVAEAQTKVAVGAFNPLTMNGTIVVDGVASAHSDWFLDGVVSADTQAKVYHAILPAGNADPTALELFEPGHRAGAGCDDAAMTEATHQKIRKARKSLHPRAHAPSNNG